MKAASAAMDTLLATGGPFFLADLYTLTLKSGATLRYTDSNVDLVVGGQTFFCSGPVFTREKTRLVLGLEAASMSITLSAGAESVYNGKSWIQNIREGLLDGAIIRVDRLIAPDWTDTSAGAICMFQGEARDTQATRLTAEINVTSLAYKFDMPLPKNSYEPGCSNNLFDTKCKAVKATFSVNKLAKQPGSTNFAIYTNSTGIGDPNRWKNGTITFTGGPNSGQSRTIKQVVSGDTFEVSNPFILPPNNNDTFVITMGCDKTYTTCQSRFSNKDNYRGFPYVPNPETLA